MPPRLVPLAAAAGVVVAAVIFVAVALRPPDVVAYAPTTPAPREAGPGLVGPVLYTVDATDTERWRHFSFRLGSVVDDADPKGWDLAFRRYQIIVNGGVGYQGQGGVADLGAVPFADVRTLPTSGYDVTETRPDPRTAAIASWYRYGFFSHVLTPRPHVWAVRTADARFAKMEMVAYYCPGSRPGCVTFRYVYQADGSPLVAVR